MANDSVPEDGRFIYSITAPLSTIIILANLPILLGIAFNRQLHNTPNYFFLSLLVADLCTGVALPFIPFMSLNRSLGFTACLLVHIFPNFLFLSFLFNLVIVHYERYLCISSPLQYGRFWVHRHFPLALLAVWAPPLLYASLPAFGWNQVNNSRLDPTCLQGNCSVDSGSQQLCSYRLIFPNAYIYLEVYGLLLPSILCIVGMTGRVLLIARSRLRDTCRLQRACGHQEAEQRLNLRYAKCVAAVSLAFLLCWVPYIVYLHVSLALMRQGPALGGASTSIVLSCTGIGSTALIPVVLGLGNRQYTDPARRLIRKLLDRCRRGQAVTT